MSKGSSVAGGVGEAQASAEPCASQNRHGEKTGARTGIVNKDKLDKLAREGGSSRLWKPYQLSSRGIIISWQQRAMKNRKWL